MSITLTVTAKGQITLRKEVLRHLNARPGDKLRVDLLEGGRLQLRPRKARPVTAIFGMLAKPETPLSIQEISETAASGWAGERENHC